MSDVVLAALITACGAIVVALIALYQHRAGERSKAEAVETERRLVRSDALFEEYRLMIAAIKADRDEWRRRAEEAERHN